MFLGELLRGEDAKYVRGNGSLVAKGITADSRETLPGTAFFCVRGMYHNGNDFARNALEKGAVAVVTEDEALAGELSAWLDQESEKHSRLEAAVILTKDVRLLLAHASAAFFGRPAERLTIIGVTGTKGKTTCTYVIKSILENAGRKVGLIGTNEVIIGRQHLETVNTTPDAILLHGYFRRMVDEGLDTVVMEVSSQAIKLRRTDGILFDYAIFTNLSPDHVAPGEHRDFQEYLECKRELFRRCKVGIVNLDDPYVERITEGHTCELDTYGFGKNAMLRAENVACITVGGRLGVEFQVKGSMEFDVRLPMPGRFSVYNALAAISLCKRFRVRESDVQRSMLVAKVKGRMECALSRDGWHVLIDYAHNPMALASLLGTLREYRPGRLICLFGCGGDRPAMRRRLMGKISGELADLTLVTDDNPRSEDPAGIREEIAEGVRESGGDYLVIPGRREAIRYALSIAKRGDLILLAGKGHETYQEVKGKKFPMDEREIIREIQNETCHTQTSL